MAHFTMGNGLTKADLKDFGIPAIHMGRFIPFIITSHIQQKLCKQGSSKEVKER
ncbi:restriction endonuclease subunit S [Helicobacter muridarum]|uniref:restriction endonuclease subunit S n=1 Tax=Helicobacter muridarum TaxID=216 RepID=UPI0011C06927|nr:restriction endonuclease subunit S [Helicobacter muridarum]